MESSCLLCLEFNRDLLKSIKANSSQWHAFGITKVLEKHFWTMDIHVDSCICLSCWQVIAEFHKFYLRVQEAHENFAKIQVKEEPYVTSKEEDTIDESINFVHECLESEILIEQNALKGLEDDNGSEVSGTEDNKYHFEHNNIHEDPLEKLSTVKVKNKKNVRTKTTSESELCGTNAENVVKLEPADSADNDDSDSVSDSEDVDSSENENTKNRSSRKENDKFIAEHFKQIFCDLCEMPFEDFSSVLKHFSAVHKVRRGYLVCCNRKYYQRNPLVDHLHSHLDPDYFKCNQCGKILSSRKSLNNHMLRVHRPNDIAQKHSCDICGKSFIQGYLLRTHKLIHLPKEEKKFPCNECGKRYGSSNLLKRHTEVVHHKKHSKVCYICGKTLGTSTEYKAHMNKHEGISHPIVNCDVCGLRLTSERSLKLHKESQHPIGGKKEHPCPVCNRVSPSARALKKHIVTMHERGCDHKCTVCEKAFRRAEALKEHMASQHIGAPLYTCPWCPKTFNSNGNMHAHRKNVHPKESLELRLQKYS